MENIKTEDLYLTISRNGMYYVVVYKPTNTILFNVSKSQLENIKKCWPELEIRIMEAKSEEHEDDIQVAPGLWFIDGKYYDSNMNEYVSPEEYYERIEDL